MSEFYEQVYDLVCQVPAGCVTTYGAIARMLGRPRHARGVGFALRVCPDPGRIPWHRVLNAQGTISMRDRDPRQTALQRDLLAREGVVFDGADRVDLQRFGWGGITPPPGNGASGLSVDRPKGWAAGRLGGTDAKRSPTTGP